MGSLCECCLLPKPLKVGEKPLVQRVDHAAACCRAIVNERENLISSEVDKFGAEKVFKGESPAVATPSIAVVNLPAEPAPVTAASKKSASATAASKSSASDAKPAPTTAASASDAKPAPATVASKSSASDAKPPPATAKASSSKRKKSESDDSFDRDLKKLGKKLDKKKKHKKHS